MPQPLKVLIVEDNPADAEMELLELRSAGFEPDWLRVETEAAYLENLNSGLDLVLSDFQMPQFNGLRALELLKQSKLDVPFILVSGTIGEDTAVAAIQKGATDYLLKDRLARLGPAVSHALTKTRLRREQRRADEAEQLHLAELRVLFDLIPAMIWFKDTKNRILRVNKRAADAAGKSVAEIEGKPSLEIYPQEAARFYTDDLEVLSSGVPKLGYVEMLPGPEGKKLWRQTDRVPVRAKGGNIIGLVVITQDITERKQVDEHLLQAQKMEALGQFSGGVAHDFNNILAAIGGYTELVLMQRPQDPLVQEHLTAVIRATNRAADLVRQILAFSRQQPQAREVMLLQPVVVESMKLMRATIPSTIEIDALIAADVPTVLANANQVHQVLMNLAINAWHAMKGRPGRVQVKLEKFVVDAAYAATQPRLQPGDFARVCVSDTGSGMDQVTLRQIFEPFFTTKPVGEGTGLGLAVVHGIMESHDGAVTVHSQPGEGAEFCLYFPAHAGETALIQNEQVPAPRGHGERVLVVDDEELLAQLCENVLTKLGYTVESTTESVKALELVRADPARFALVITDQTMPKMTGLQLASQLREIRSGLPIMLMTGYNLSLTADRVEASGISNILLKPFTIHTLGNAVQATLSGTIFKRNGSNSPH